MRFETIKDQFDWSNDEWAETWLKMHNVAQDHAAVPRLPLDGHTWASPQGSGLQAEICCAEGQQQQAECGNPGGVNKVQHTNKMAQKHKTGHRKIMDSPVPLDGRVTA